MNSTEQPDFYPEGSPSKGNPSTGDSMNEGDVGGVMAVDPTGGWCGTKEQAHAIFGPLAGRAEYEKLPSINDPEPPPTLADHLGVGGTDHHTPSLPQASPRWTE